MEDAFQDLRMRLAKTAKKKKKKKENQQKRSPIFVFIHINTSIPTEGGGEDGRNK